jgi:predicted PurR-regulated permease PerM
MMLRPKQTAPLASHEPNKKERSPYWWLRWVPAAILTILILDLIYVLGSVAIVPVLASFALAYLLNPIVQQFEKRGLSRPIAASVALLIVALVISSFIIFVTPGLIEQAGKSATELKQRYFTAQNAERQRRNLRRISPLLDDLAGERVQQFIADPQSVFGSPRTWFAGNLSDFLSTAAGALDLFLVPFFVFYILVDFRKWRDSLEDLIPPRFRDPFSRLFDEVGRILESYVRGQLLIAAIMAGLYAVGFALLGVPAWAGIAILSGFLNLIPYVGTALGIVLATGFTLADGGGFAQIAGVLGVFVAVQSVEGYYLTPRILGGRLSLHSMAVFLGLLIGGRLFGFLGIILAVPTIAVAKVFLKFLRELYKASEFYHAGDLEPHEAPADAIEERIADAAETVLAEQVSDETGEELLSPKPGDDDPLAQGRIEERPAS